MGQVFTCILGGAVEYGASRNAISVYTRSFQRKREAIPEVV